MNTQEWVYTEVKAKEGLELASVYSFPCAIEGQAATSYGVTTTEHGTFLVPEHLAAQLLPQMVEAGLIAEREQPKQKAEPKKLQEQGGQG